MSETNHWQTKLAAWTHDPAEKALVLLRDPAGHEGGTVARLQQAIFSMGIPKAVRHIMTRADHWASAADRPNWPRDDSGRYQRWAQVRFTEKPVLIHPLSGEEFNLGKLHDIQVEPLKAVSLDHFQSLLQHDAGGAINARNTALAFWRFGPQLEAEGLTTLWRQLPADTRVPDHSIWSHLDLTSAFASAMVQSEDQQPALLTMSFGPVQDFIAQARSTSDLWAGSHLLSRMVWEGLKVIAERCGPDAVVFPQLRGVALVDAWLQNEMGLPEALFAAEDWRTQTQGTDANPLFAAALPNKFTAIVPASMARELAEQVTQAVRCWVLDEARGMLESLLDRAEIEADEDLPCWQQLTEQLMGFPEVHWASVPWSLVARDDQDRAAAGQSELKQLLCSLVPEGESFLDSDAWALLSKELELEGASFFVPNPGLLYPALFDLLDRLAATAKTARPFAALQQAGYRCTLTGEQEWLTTDREQLMLTPAKRQQADTLWNRVADNFGIKSGEHLGALGLLKRLWPTRFSDYVSELIGSSVNRFVVSTHTLAMASSLEQLAAGGSVSESLGIHARAADGVVLPRKLVKSLHRAGGDALAIAKGLPTLMDIARDSDDEVLQRSVEAELKKLSGAKPEAYFAMLYMDGDKMGAWLADSWGPGEGDDKRLRYCDTWHPQIRAGLEQRFSAAADGLAYTGQHRPLSPARHMAISGALNSFALDIARHVVEDCYMGKLLYAGGDDVMAMIAVKDLLPCLLTLRLAYSGVWPTKPTAVTADLLNLEKMKIGRGHVRLKNTLHRVMGYRATASAGAVIAHHKAPLTMVLRQLRAAEQDAKHSGRDAFALRVIKRGGGAEHLSMPWLLPHQQWSAMPELESTSMGLLMDLRDQLAREGELSRRLAYIVNTWLPQLPDSGQFEHDTDAFITMIETTLAAQLGRQGGEANFAHRLMQLVAGGDPACIKQELRNVFAVAEFFARNNRSQGDSR